MMCFCFQLQDCQHIAHNMNGLHGCIQMSTQIDDIGDWLSSDEMFVVENSIGFICCLFLSVGCSYRLFVLTTVVFSYIRCLVSHPLVVPTSVFCCLIRRLVFNLARVVSYVGAIQVSKFHQTTNMRHGHQAQSGESGS